MMFCFQRLSLTDLDLRVDNLSANASIVRHHPQVSVAPGEALKLVLVILQRVQTSAACLQHILLY